MPTGQEIKDQIDLDITNKTAANSIIPPNVGVNMKDVVDYVDQETTPKADIDSPDFTGIPTAPTPSANDNSTRLATTEYVDNASTGNPTFGDVLQENNVVEGINAQYFFRLPGNTETICNAQSYKIENLSNNDKIELRSSNLQFTKDVFGLKTATLEQNPLAITNTTNTMPLFSGELALKQFLSYNAVIDQVGSNPPTVNVLGLNEIGNIVYSRTSTGVYIGTLTDAFTANTFLPQINVYSDDGKRATIRVLSVNEIEIRTFDATNTLSDDILTKSYLEIRNYL